MQNDNLYKKLRFFALCLAIICMLLSLIKRAKAEDLNSDYYDKVVEYVSDLNLDYQPLIDYKNTILNSEVTNFYIFKSDQILRIYFFDNYFIPEFNGGSSTNNQYTIYNNYYAILNNSSLNLYCYECGFTLQGQITYSVIYKDSINSRFSSFVYNGNTFQEISVSHSSVYGNHELSTLTWYWSDKCVSNLDYLYFTDANRGYDLSNYIEILEPPINTNTNGFVVYKQTIHNHDFLMIDFSKCINWAYATNSNYYLGNSSFDIYIDGNKETIELDDNTYYTYDESKQKAYFQIPITYFSAFGYDNATNVYINNVNINYGIVVGMPMNFEAHYISDVYLKKASNINFEPDDTQLENEIAYQDNITYVEQYNDYIAYNDNSFNMEYTIDQPLYANVEAAKASINGTAKTFTIQTWYDSENTNKIYFLPLETTTSDRIELWEYIANNPFALYCDVLIVQVKRYTLPTSYNSNTPWEYTHDVGAMVIYTQRYYIRNSTNGILTSLVDITEYEKITSQYTYWLYDLAYDKLTNMDNNMSVYFNSSLDVINNILETLDNINNSLSNIDDILNKIFDSLKDLNISQLDSIDSKLSTIIDNITTETSDTLNEDDTVAEAIQYYKTHNNNGVPTAQVYIDDKMSIWISGKVHLWLQGTDANTDKTNLINSVFDTLISIYDSMKNNNDIFPNIQYYLDAIAKNNEYGYETHGDYMTRLFKGNVDISTYDGISE